MDEDETTQQTGGDESATRPGNKWGDPISKERQAELRALFERQKAWVAQPEATRGDSVFRSVRLTGADVRWLATASMLTSAGRIPPHRHLAVADLLLTLSEGTDLTQTLFKSDAVGLGGAQLEGAYLREAQLEGAYLREAQLKGTDLTLAQLKGANLREAQLKGASLIGAQLTRADLRGAAFDMTSRLNGAEMTGASLDQVTYDGVNLTVVDWSLVPVLGDEVTARQRKDEGGKPKDREQRLEEFTAAVRANRVLAVTLRSQGMNEDADRYAYRAQLLQRTVVRLRRRWGAAFGSWLLDVVSGYGYKPVRSIIAYVGIILFFAGLYLLNGQFAAPHLRWDEALILSISSFHGRGFFTTGISLGDTLARLAAGEAIIGLLIEITFIATFTQRFFAR